MSLTGLFDRLPWRRRKPSKPAIALEWAARAGYASRGFVLNSSAAIFANATCPAFEAL